MEEYLFEVIMYGMAYFYINMSECVSFLEDQCRQGIAWHILCVYIFLIKFELLIFTQCCMHLADWCISVYIEFYWIVLSVTIGILLLILDWFSKIVTSNGDITFPKIESGTTNLRPA